MSLIEIIHPAIDFDLRYATSENITGRPLYDRAVALLRADAHRALIAAAERVAARGLRLRVFDAYRPVAAQRRLWAVLPDPRFVADPRTGSLHNLGIAVDLTLATREGVPLDMGTGFDEMTPRSSHGRTDVSDAGRRHRALLLETMTATGWVHHPHEWWHYNLPLDTPGPAFCDATEGRRLMDADASPAS